ncbi:MAG: glutathione peroxidase [Pseudotabrizicola sp.]|uniref:glutathione peroxidase n=1 Tax=Pseudotabrizicola sp. TaxID=2939647 RepID=UPI002730AA09|nr:glutathione peroxidase [Pseudotabrizicola sp.]MDP2080447.1 glutathione peroxidase [Pseudotabrizicola sp.]MDZ7573709.1 glutathione peroxidase [Pseudotabrizicola sp.]
MRRRMVLAGIGIGLLAFTGQAATLPGAGAFSFASIDGGIVDLADWRGKPVLVVNTASLCGFAGQFDDLQALHERYGARGLLVLAVPSDDFNQELADAQAVKEYCAVNFDLTLPMTDITHVRGEQAHPFYKWMAAEHGFTPGWNFNKVLIGAQGEVLGTWGSAVKPTAGAITKRIEPLLR